MPTSNDLHKWAATVTAIGVLMWGALAYYVTAEDAKMQLTIEARLNQIERQQETSLKINALVISIDKKLATIEHAITRQKDIIADVRDLRLEMNKLQYHLQLKDKNYASNPYFKNSSREHVAIPTDGKIP